MHDQYDKWSSVYDLLWRRYLNQTVPVARETAAIKPRERVLDLACGTGELLRRIVQHTSDADLTGVDIAPGMVERARAKLAGVSDAKIEQADAHDLPFRDGSFDVVVCANTFHYFTHPTSVLGEVRRVLRPDGRFVVLDWCRDYWTCRVMDAVLRVFDPAHQNCYTLDELAAILDDAGFAGRESFRYRFDIVWGMMVVVAEPV